MTERTPATRARSGAALALALVLVSWAAVEGVLSRRPDLDDHGRWAAALSLTIARNYLRYGLAEDATPLANGGSYELAREAPYFDQPTGDHLALAAWLRVTGVSVPAARARTVVWGLLALVALAWGAAGVREARAGPWALALALGTIPIVLYYDHAAFPPAVAASAVAIAAGARLRRLSGGGAGALVVQALALVVVLGTSWKGILFAGVWGLSDLVALRRGERRRDGLRDGLWLLWLALVVLAVEVLYLETHGGLAAWLAKGAKRAGSPGPVLVAVVRVLRYGRGLGYGHVLLGLAWAVAAVRRLRAGRSTLADRVALELFLAPVPWFLVFRERVANHDHEMLYFAPALAVASWQTLSDLAARARGSLRVGLVALMLVVTGGAVAGVIEHKDDLASPRVLGDVARFVATPDEAVATNLRELSISWESDRYCHTGVESLEALEALLAKSGPTRPRYFLLEEGEGTDALARALAAKFSARRVRGVLVFELPLK